MPSYTKDPRCIALAEVLVPLLRRSCPQDAGGFGGSFQVNLDDEEAVGLGGGELIRAAMRKTARQLDWKVETIGWIGTRFGTMVAVRDTREVPEGHRAVVDAAMYERMSAAAARVSAEPSEAPVQRGSATVMTQEFRAAVAEASGTLHPGHTCTADTQENAG
ncbi:hypothetical protein ACFYSF_35955 [Streptomyces canus]|uniref:hypothetical protein n=1 Tax=Streptomyces canus TaxID=58343 RepID=UPI0036B28E6B